MRGRGGIPTHANSSGRPDRVRVPMTPTRRRDAREPSRARPSQEFLMAFPLDKLVDAGVSIWLDDLSRVRLAEGGLDRLNRDRHVTGVTTNPTIFAKAISGSDAYSAHIDQLALRQVGVDTALRELTATDVRWAADVLRPTFD